MMTRVAMAVLLVAGICGLARAEPAELGKVADVRALSRADEFVSHPVRLQGVLISDLSGGGMFLQDDTASIWLHGNDWLFIGLRRGDMVEARGRAAPGRFAPVITTEWIAKLGTAPIPPPVRVTFDDLQSGRYDAQWVEIDGIVRNVAYGSLDLATGGGRLPVSFTDANDGNLPVDSGIRVQGIALYQFTRGGQVMHPLLAVPVGVKPTILAPPPPEPSLRRIDRLMAFSDKLDHGHRVRIRGTVIHHQPGEALWLEENGHGIRVNLADPGIYAAGEVVEVTGFPVRGGNYTPEMEDVAITRISRGEPPPPVLLDSAIKALDHDAGLVTLEAKILEIMRVPLGLRFVLRDKDRDFIAHLRDGKNVIPPDWQAGSLVRATGICGVSAVPATSSSGTVDPREFELIIRTPADIHVLIAPPWWNSERRFRLLAGIIVALGIVTLGVLWAARRGQQRSADARRQSEAEFSAILAERNRIAREIHDTLAQGLGAIQLQHEMLKDHLPPGSEAASHLREASQITRDCLRESRESIWNMRSQALEENGLAGALAGVFDHLTDIDGIEGDFDLTGEPVRLPPIVENNLLRIGQEAIANAVKHAEAKRIDVTVDYAPRKVSIRVKDDGRGFDPDKAPAGGLHFGLVGLRERAHEAGATIRFVSSPGRGTEVVLECPLTSPSHA